MKICKNCNVKVSDETQNCPLCGAQTKSIHTDDNFQFVSYPDLQPRTKRNIVRNIFIVVSIILCAFTLIASLLSHIMGIFYITLASVVFTWLTILRHVFFFDSVRHILTSDILWLSVLSMLICGHFQRIDIAFSIVIPALLAALNCALCMIVFITGKWYKYAYPTTINAVIEVCLLFVNVIAKWSFVASLVCAGLGLITLLFSCIFGRKTMITELKKRLFM
ncbi:MAG: DUF6320 domain-containing protein [Clostridia bacterium]